jgi:hypothetical protein
MDRFIIWEKSAMKFVDLHHGTKHQERVGADIGLMYAITGNQFFSRSGWEFV